MPSSLVYQPLAICIFLLLDTTHECNQIFIWLAWLEVNLKLHPLHCKRQPSQKQTMDDIHGGFECEFTEKPPKAVQSECPVCLLVLREPYQAMCCGYSFCKVCIEKIKESFLALVATQADSTAFPTKDCNDLCMISKSSVLTKPKAVSGRESWANLTNTSTTTYLTMYTG